MRARWFAFELAWLSAWCSAVLGSERVIRPSFWTTFSKAAPWPLFWGLRACVWGLNLARLLPQNWRRTREALVTRWNGGNYLQRQMVMTVKVVACFDYFDADEP